jgi:hypothetical protein
MTDDRGGAACRASRRSGVSGTRRFRPAWCRRWASADTRTHYRVGRGVIERPAAQATVHAQGGHARGA